MYIQYTTAEDWACYSYTSAFHLTKGWLGTNYAQIFIYYALSIYLRIMLKMGSILYPMICYQICTPWLLYRLKPLLVKMHFTEKVNYSNRAVSCQIVLSLLTVLLEYIFPVICNFISKDL